MERAGEDRAVSTIIGAVFLLGLLVILLSIYQAVIIPNQNERVEFGHSQDVQNDMLDLRNAILEAKSTGETTFSAVKLGTRYPARLIGINPGPASGALRTGEPRPITLTEGGVPQENFCPKNRTDPSQSSFDTRILKYTPDYNIYQNAPTIVYENTVLYLNFSGRNILLTDEQLVENDGTTVNINPVNTSYSEQGVEAESVEPIPGTIEEEEVSSGEVTLPTQLSQSEWRDLLDEDLPDSAVTVSNGELTLDISGEINVACSPLGLNTVPEGGEREEDDVNINPAGPGDIELEGANVVGNGKAAFDLVLNNTGDKDVDIVEARLTFYNNRQDSKGDPDPLELRDPATGQVAVTLQEYDDYAKLNPEILLDADGNPTSIQVDRTGGDDYDGEDWLVIEMRFSNGKQATYFIDIP